jgi:hypothetical protein
MGIVSSCPCDFDFYPIFTGMIFSRAGREILEWGNRLKENGGSGALC